MSFKTQCKITVNEHLNYMDYDLLEKYVSKLFQSIFSFFFALYSSNVYLLTNSNLEGNPGWITEFMVFLPTAS